MTMAEDSSRKAKQRAYDKEYRQLNKARLEEKRKAWVAANRERLKAYHKAWREKNAEKLREAMRRKRAENPEQERYRVRQRRYRQQGWTVEQYEEAYERQGGVCAICGEAPGKEPLHADHDHSTGRARDLLCGPCNRALGLLKDDPQRMENMMKYVKRHKEAPCRTC